LRVIGAAAKAFRAAWAEFGRLAVSRLPALRHSSATLPPTKDVPMLAQILTHTPRWVWILLIALLWLGLSQAVARSASLKRITLLPLVMTGLSLSGTVSAFGADPLLLLVWCAAAAVALLLVPQALSPATRYDPATRRFSLPGSWTPLALILGIFLTKYTVGVATALHPELTQYPGFSLGVSALYGAFSGVFVARTARLWRLALRHGREDAAPGALLA
jgi:hypothetical protein